jgi:hypothetical protein
MTETEFDNTWFKMVASNSTWDRAAINDKTIRMYRDRLIQYPVGVFEEAIKQLQNDKTDRLPSVGSFLEYCRMIEGEQPKQKVKTCSCCGGTGFLLLKCQDGQERAFDCDCYIEQGNDRRTANYRNFGLNKCHSLTCPNPGGKTKIEVPIGSFYYYKAKLATCQFRPALVEVK